MTYNQKEATTKFAYELYDAKPEDQRAMLEFLEERLAEWTKLAGGKKLELNELLSKQKGK